MQDTVQTEADGDIKLTLPAILDLNAAAQLQSETAAATKSGKPVVIDAGGVQRMSSLCLQILASARRSMPDGIGFAITNCSAVFAEMASDLALSEALGLTGDLHE
jgi:anti-anti-sigma regulatory factor